jgi:hypothetical protein
MMAFKQSRATDCTIRDKFLSAAADRKTFRDPMSGSRKDINLQNDFQTTTQYLGRLFHTAAHALLIGACPFPEMARSLAYDPSDPPELASRFGFFQANWPALRAYPNFTALFLCVFASAIRPQRPFALLVELMQQTACFDVVLLNVFIPVVFQFFGCCRIDDLFAGVVARFSFTPFLNLYCSFLSGATSPIFFTSLRNLILQNPLTPDQKQLIIAAISQARVSHAAIVREALQASPRLPRETRSSSSLSSGPGLFASYLDQIDSGTPSENPVDVVRFLAAQLRQQPFPAV